MKPASLHRRILFPLLLCGGLLFALLFWYFSPFFSPGENRRFSAYVEERFHSEVTSSAITLHYTLADPASRGIAPGTASFGTVSIPDRTSYDALLQSVKTTLTSFHRNRLSAENQITLDLLLYELDCEKMPGSTSLLAEPLGPSLGIQKDMNVIADGGLVGLVEEVSSNSATVRSIIDDSSSVSAMTASTSDTCIVSGDLRLISDGKLAFSQLNTTDTVAEGEKIVTSNISDKYLRGILIGYVSEITEDSNHLTKKGYIIPVVDFQHIQEVLVIKELKQQGGE